jgi:hypothetical protein
VVVDFPFLDQIPLNLDDVKNAPAMHSVMPLPPTIFFFVFVLWHMHQLWLPSSINVLFVPT